MTNEKLNEVKEKLHEYKTQKICDIIVTSRYLNLDEDLTIKCMEELGKRRVNGEEFDFETYIETKFQSLPVLDFKMPDLRTAIAKMGNMKEFKIE